MSLPLTELVRALELLAPLARAEPWDNVGLLIDPRPPGEERTIERVLLSIDTNESIIAQAGALAPACLVAYHPPIFSAIKALSRARHPALFEAVRHGLAVYSPHTALDAAPEGLSDWLASAFDASETAALVPSLERDASAELKIVTFVPESDADALRTALSDAGAGVIGDYAECSFGLVGEGTFHGSPDTHPTIGQAGRLERARELRLEMVCPRAALPALARVMAERHPYEEPAWDVYALEPKRHASAGQGRRVRLASPRPLGELVERVKRHLGVQRLRLATSARHAAGASIESVAVCPGAGGSLFASVSGVDLYLTGEMRHHDVLSKLSQGASVLLAEHSSSERGYLPTLQRRLGELTGGAVEIRIADGDVEPLVPV